MIAFKDCRRPLCGLGPFAFVVAGAVCPPLSPACLHGAEKEVKKATDVPQSDVKIEVDDELGVITLRGAGKDVKKVTDLIRQTEQEKQKSTDVKFEADDELGLITIRGGEKGVQTAIDLPQLAGSIEVVDGRAVITHGGCEKDGKTPTLRLRDEFDGKLTLNWEPVRPDPTHVSLTKNPGKLTITTQRGGIWQGVGPTAKNFHLIRNPLVGGGDFVLTTCIESFKPTLNWQQAGLLVYDDDDNYLKCEMEWCDTTVLFAFLRETDGTVVSEKDLSGIEHDRIWLRLTKRGKSYERAYSTDGKKFLSAGKGDWGNRKPQWIGIFAKNGPNVSDGIDAVFDFFEFRSLTPAEAADEHPPVSNPIARVPVGRAPPIARSPDIGEAPLLRVYRLKTPGSEAVLSAVTTLLGRRPLGPDFRLELDPKNGCLIALARPREHAIIEEALAQVQRYLAQTKSDEPSQAGIRPAPRMISLRHAQAKDIATAVREVYGDRLIDSGERNEGGRGIVRSQENSAGPDKSTGTQMRGVSIGVDPAANVLIVVAPDQLFREIKALVEALDRRPDTDDK